MMRPSSFFIGSLLLWQIRGAPRKGLPTLKSGARRAYSGRVPRHAFGAASALTLVDSGALQNYTAQALESLGAHEEGHRYLLDDCKGDIWCPMNATQTVMWARVDPTQPTSPTTCDLFWAGIYVALANGVP